VLRRIALAAVFVLVFVPGTMPAAAKTTTALHVESSNPPYAVFGSDGRLHVEYDLVLTNAFVGPATLDAVAVRADGKPALTLTGDARAGRLDRSTLSTPAKLGLCIAEDEERSPWQPLHVERGMEPGSSAVTVIAADAPLSISDHRSRTPDELAWVLAQAATATWSPCWWPMDDDSLFVIGPEHAAMFASAGWSKERLREAIFAAATRTAGELKRGETTPAVWESPDDRPIHKWADASRILIVVAGGEAGRYSAVLGPCDGMQTQPVTK